MSYETFELIGRLRQTGRRAAMATLVRTIGTTPRKEGTKMFVGEDGDIFGSVTIGGCVDARVIEQSQQILNAASPRLLNLNLGDEEAWEIGLSCGGAVDVFIEPFTDEIARMYDNAHNEWQAGRAVAIATTISGKDTGARQLLTDSSTWPAKSGTVTTDGREVYIELLRPPSTLLVFGGGSVGIPLVSFAKQVGLRTAVIDARPRFANRERFPEADDIRVGIVSEIVDEMKIGGSTPVVLVSHDYKVEIPILKKVLSSDVPYIGLLANRRRGAAILQVLRDDGMSEQQLARVRVPVGLDIGGESAAEIALSIVAEIIAVMRGKTGAPLSGR